MTIRKLECVTFLHPGPAGPAFCQRELKSRDVMLALAESHAPCENHELRPYAFQFETVLTSDPIDDGEGGKLEVMPKVVSSSGIYYLGGTLLTHEEARESDDREHKALLVLMEMKNTAIICICGDGYQAAGSFSKEDVIIDRNGNVIIRGDEPKFVALRKKLIAEICDA